MSEIYGTVLVISFAFVVALLLVGTGLTIVDELQTETTDSLTEDSLRNVDRAIADITGASANASTTVEFPEESGTTLSADEDSGELNITVTTNETFWNRTVAEGRGYDRTNSSVTTLGTIRQEARDRGVVAYEGGALWKRPNREGDTLLLSEPNFDYTGNSLDVGVVSLSDTDAITEGSRLEIQRGTTRNNDLQRLLELYWTDRYNPSVIVPIEETNVTIESQYADGWATYAEERLTADPEDVIYPYKGDENKVRIVIGRIGDEPVDTRNPAFGDDNVLYAGTSDFAYLYYNETAGTITGNATTFEVTDPPSSDYELALYNESGRWLIYNGTAWVDSNGNDVDPGATEAINTSRSPTSDGVAGDEYYIDPPAWLDESAAAPVCIVTNTTASPDVTEYIDENGEDCLERLVGVEESLVGPIKKSPDFNVSVETEDSDLNETYRVGENVSVKVNITNDGDATGQAPAGAYLLNESNFESGDTSEAIFFNGTRAADLELDPGESKQFEYSFQVERGLVGDNWTVFAVSDGDAGVSRNATTGNATTFSVPRTDAQFNVTDVDPAPDPVDVGETVSVTVDVNESAEEITSPVTQQLSLTADGRIVNQTDVTLDSGENTSVVLEWVPGTGDAGDVTLEASTFDSTGTASITVNGPDPPESNFAVDIVGTNSSITEGQNLTVDVNVTNTGDLSDTQNIVLNNFDDGPVDQREVTLGDGDTALVTLTWETVVGNNGTGPIDVVSADDSDSTDVEITPRTAETEDPVDVVFVLDESGSMGDPACSNCTETKAEAAIEATKNAIGSLDASQDRAGAVFFDTTADKKETLTSDFSATGINSTIEGLFPSGGTRSDRGIEKANEIFDDRSKESRNKATVLLSDGANDGCKPADNGGDTSLITNDDPRDCDANNRTLDLTQEAADDGVTTYSVGYGNLDPSEGPVEFDEAFLQRTAEIGGGEYYYARDDEQLAQAFESIVSDITEPETPTFEVDIVDTNDPVGAGETLEVEVSVENTGTDGERIVSLLDNEGSYVDSESVSLASGSSTTRTLDWYLTDVDPGEKDISVRTVDDEDDATIEVEEPPDGPALQINSLSKSADPVTAGNDLDVTVELENVGEQDAVDRPVALSVNNSDTGDLVARDFTRVDIPAGDTGTAVLTWSTTDSDVGDYDLTVETDVNTSGDTVTVEPVLTDLNATIISTDDPVQAGGELEVFVNVTNNGSETEERNILLNDTRTSTGAVDVALGVEIPPGSSEVVNLTWNTRIGDGDENPVPIRARIANTNEFDTASVEIREADTDLEDASIAESGEPIDVDLDEIELES